MREEQTGIDTPTHTLATSIAFAKDDTDTNIPPRGVIVMFAGSGPIDRNENLPRFSMNIFNALAEQFSEAGYASLRYDKRGCGASGGDYITAGHSDLVNDAVFVTRFIHQHKAFKDVPIYLLGHSEGTVIAPQVVKRVADDITIKGLMLLCPFTRPMREVLLQQAENRTAELNAMAGVSGAIAKAFVKMRGGYTGIQRKFLKRVENSTTDTVNVGKATLNAKWYREMLALDAEALWKSVDVPTFAIGGGKDLQCNPDDTHALASLITQAPIDTHVEEHLTHILRRDEAVPAMGRYPELIKQPIESLVAMRCIRWLKTQHTDPKFIQ